MKVIRLLTPTVVGVALVVSGCSTRAPVPPPQPTCPDYTFTAPEHAPAHSRLEEIGGVVRTCSGSLGCSAPCARYQLEAGLIWEKVLEQDQDAIHPYRASMQLAPQSCDARMLLASVLSRKRRDPRARREAARLLADSGDACGTGTLPTFHRAKLRVLSGETDMVREGRRDLEGLSTLRLGRSGVTQSDVHGLLVYSYLAESDFAAAARRMAASPGVPISAKLRALMILGQGRAGDLVHLPASDRARARAFLLQSLSHYRPQPAIEALVADAANDFGHVEQIPWAELEERWQRAGASSWEQGAQKEIARYEHRKLQGALARRTQVLETVEQELGRVRQAEIELIRRQIEAGLAGDTEGVGQAAEVYRAAHQRLAGAVAHLVAEHELIWDSSYAEHFLRDPGSLEREQRRVAEYRERHRRLQESDVVAEVLEGFAVAKSRALTPDDFFSPFEVALDDLTPAAQPVVENVRRIASLEGQEL